jgi:alpha-beta hydrolase superfamily lysophospholipase
MPDGTLLRTLRWEPVGKPWATALIVHGLGEHCGRYGNVAAPLAAAGIDTHACDLRGFGGSAGPRAYVDRWGQLHDDLEQLLTGLRAGDTGRPVILYGHSLGALLAGGYVLADLPRPAPDLLVLSAPAIDDDLPRWKHAAAGLLGSVVPRMRVSNGPLGDEVSHDPSVVAAYVSDPLMVPSTTVRFGREAAAEQARVRAALAGLDRMPVPTYVLHGSADTIVPLRASEAFAGKGNVAFHVHEGLRHETHNEFEHGQVVAEIVAWIGDWRAASGVDAAAESVTAAEAGAAAV